MKSSKKAPAAQVKLLTREQVLAMLGDVTYPSVFGWIRDGLFPAGIELGAVSGKGRVMWIEAEVLAWIAARPRRLLKGRKPVKEDA
jgi:predicted DNA-binding transcriptional regulator AlpA